VAQAVTLEDTGSGARLEVTHPDARVCKVFPFRAPAAPGCEQIDTELIARTLEKQPASGAHVVGMADVDIAKTRFTVVLTLIPDTSGRWTREELGQFVTGLVNEFRGEKGGGTPEYQVSTVGGHPVVELMAPEPASGSTRAVALFPSSRQILMLHVKGPATSADEVKGLEAQIVRASSVPSDIDAATFARPVAENVGRVAGRIGCCVLTLAGAAGALVWALRRRPKK
jgi:hypothetical protein